MKKRIIFPLIVLSLLTIYSCSKEKKIFEVRYAPVLYDLVAPDSLEKGSPSLSYIFVSAFDPDGYSDIDSVYFITTRPDSSINPTAFHLHDDGQFGDSAAVDGRYSIGIQAPGPQNLSGDYIFTFYAVDKQGDKSNNLQAIVTAY